VCFPYSFDGVGCVRAREIPKKQEQILWRSSSCMVGSYRNIVLMAMGRSLFPLLLLEVLVALLWVALLLVVAMMIGRVISGFVFSSGVPPTSNARYLSFVPMAFVRDMTRWNTTTIGTPVLVPVVPVTGRLLGTRYGTTLS
jgi:hypothetical protein